MLNTRRMLLILALAVVGLTTALHWPTRESEPAPRTLKVRILNNRPNTYVWVDPRVSVQVWKPGADASEDPLGGTIGQLVLPHNRLGNGFEIPENGFAEGYISLPKGFPLEGYIQDGQELHLAVAVVPRGIFSNDAPFDRSPDIEWSNAYATVPLSSNFPPSVISLTPDDG